MGISLLHRKRGRGGLGTREDLGEGKPKMTSNLIVIKKIAQNAFITFQISSATYEAVNAPRMAHFLERREREKTFE